MAEIFVQFVEPCEDGLCMWGSPRPLSRQMAEVREDVLANFANGKGHVEFRGFSIHWRLASE